MRYAIASDMCGESFPSPCGVLVLKAAILEDYTVDGTRSFRPLAGFWFLKRQVFKMKAQFKGKFPSPCGVLVLKGGKVTDVSSQVFNGFRPLAGFWFLKGATGTHGCVLARRVSVPLRGSGS